MESPAPPTIPSTSLSPTARAGHRHLALTLIATLLLSLSTYLILPADMGELGRRAVAIAVFAAILWATEAIPLVVTSLGIIGLEVLLLARHGGLAGTGNLKYSTFFEPFASSTVILFLGGFMLAAAVTKHGLDRTIASRLLRPFIADSYKLIFAVILTTGALSIFISNTATAAMMLAIITPITRLPGVSRKLASALVLAVAFGASIGGFITPVSTPPNAITISQLKEIGVHISFAQWVLMAAPLSIGMLLVTGVLLCIILRPPRKTDLPLIAPPEKLSKKALATGLTIAATVLAWLTGPLHHVDDAAIALIAATLLASFGILDRTDIKTIDWDILLLMWGGLSLGLALNLTGVLEYTGSLPFLSHISHPLLALLIIAGGMTFATFMSNTAAANILVPLAIALSIAPHNPEATAAATTLPTTLPHTPEAIRSAAHLAVLAGLTVSFAISLPISTPPNAMAYATGLITSKQMIQTGLLVSLLSIAALMTGYFFILPLAELAN